MLPPVVLSDIVGRDRDGELVAVPSEWNDAETSGPLPVSSSTRRARRSPASPARRRRPRADMGRARPRRRSERSSLCRASGQTFVTRPASLLGVLRIEANGAGRIEPIEKKQAGRELVIAAEDIGAAKDGDLVSVDLIGKTRSAAPRAKVREFAWLRHRREGREPDRVACPRHTRRVRRRSYCRSGKDARGDACGRPPPRGLARPAARHHRPAGRQGSRRRRSRRASLAEDNEGGFIVTVAIADVAVYVRPHSALDRDALERGNSVYFPDRVVPMLPERISNDLCSLRADEDRPALAVRLRIARNGRKVGHSFDRVMMRSCAKLNYAQAQAAMDGHPDETTVPLLDNVLKPLWEA